MLCKGKKAVRALPFPILIRERSAYRFTLGPGPPRGIGRGSVAPGASRSARSEHRSPVQRPPTGTLTTIKVALHR